MTLMGKVKWHYQKEEADKALHYLEGVKGLINQIEIEQAVTPSDVTQRIENALKRDAELEAKQIRVEPRITRSRSKVRSAPGLSARPRNVRHGPHQASLKWKTTSRSHIKHGRRFGGGEQPGAPPEGASPPGIGDTGMVPGHDLRLSRIHAGAVRWAAPAFAPPHAEFSGKTSMEQNHWQNWITLAVGIWLAISPWILAPGTDEGVGMTLTTWNFVLSGGAATLIAAAAILAYYEWEEWLDTVLGLWIVASPWVVGFTAETALFWNALICGAVIAALSAWTAVAARSESAV